MADSRSLAGEKPRIPHLARPNRDHRGGDLREDVDRAFCRIETEVDVLASGLPAPIPATSIRPIETAGLVTGVPQQTTRCDPTSNPMTVQLPAIGPTNEGKIIEVKVVIGNSPGSALPNNVTILPDGLDTIDGAGNFVISIQRGSVTVRSDGVSDWMIV